MSMSQFLNVLALGFLAVIVRNPAMMNELRNDGYDDDMMGDFGSPPLPTPVSIERPPQYAYRDHHTLNYHNIDMGGLVCLCMIAITLMLIYGAIKGKPSHLLPFFCLQLFDFAITTLTAARYLCFIRSIHRVISDNESLPYRNELLRLSPQTLSVVVLFSFISVVFLKAYTIGIIWRCYKYLTMRQHNLRSMLPYIIPDVTVRQERDYSSLLPDYEEAVLKQAPPPSYSVAVANSYPITVILPAEVEMSPSTSRNVMESAMPPPPYSDAMETEGAVGGQAASLPVTTVNAEHVESVQECNTTAGENNSENDQQQKSGNNHKEDLVDKTHAEKIVAPQKQDVDDDDKDDGERNLNKTNGSAVASADSQSK